MCVCVCVCVCFDSLRPSQKSAMSGRAILCWSCTEQRSISHARGHSASLDPQLLGLKSSTLLPSHCAPFAVWRKCNVVLLTQLCHTGLLVISFAACFFSFFLQQNMLTLPRAVAHLSRVIRLLPSMRHECNEPEQNATSLYSHLFSLTLAVT